MKELKNYLLESTQSEDFQEEIGLALKEFSNIKYIYEVNKNDEEDLPSIEFSGPFKIKTSDGIEFVKEPNSTRFDSLSYVYKFPNKDGLRLYSTGRNNPVYIDYIGHYDWPVRDKFDDFEEAAIHAVHLYNKYKKQFKY